MDQEFVNELTQVNQTRAQFMRFLASLMFQELTSEQVEAFAHLRYEDDGTPIAKGYAQIVEYLRHRDSATRQTLAVDYAHTFLGAGTYNTVMAPPYESVFTSSENMLMQEARDGALAYYRSEGLDLPADNNIPEDHLAFELQFMATLVERSSQAAADGDEARLRELVTKQMGFMKYHQANWIGRLCAAIDEFCTTDFYHGVANVLRGYLQMERDVLSQIACDLGIGYDVAELRSTWMDQDLEDAIDGAVPMTFDTAHPVAEPVIN